MGNAANESVFPNNTPRQTVKYRGPGGYNDVYSSGILQLYDWEAFHEGAGVFQEPSASRAGAYNRQNEGPLVCFCKEFSATLYLPVAVVCTEHLK